MVKENSLTRTQMLEATFERDSTFDGVFYFGVKTTGIYCLPSCKSRKPLEENVIFFHTKEQAINAGFRGCLRCNSEKFPETKPQWYFKLKELLEKEIYRKITEDELIKIAKVDISTIRRCFKSYHNVTPLKYHRKIRLNHAYQSLKAGDDIINVSHKFGFKSSSGFREAFNKEFGYSPSKI